MAIRVTSTKVTNLLIHQSKCCIYLLRSSKLKSLPLSEGNLTIVKIPVRIFSCYIYLLENVHGTLSSTSSTILVWFGAGDGKKIFFVSYNANLFMANINSLCSYCRTYYVVGLKLNRWIGDLIVSPLCSFILLWKATPHCCWLRNLQDSSFQDGRRGHKYQGVQWGMNISKSCCSIYLLKGTTELL